MFPKIQYANGHVSATGDPIHFMFGSRVGFSGSADDDFWRAAKTGGDRTGVLFGKRLGQAADAHLLLLAGSQHRCSADRAEAQKV